MKDDLLNSTVIYRITGSRTYETGPPAKPYLVESYDRLGFKIECEGYDQWGDNLDAAVLPILRATIEGE